MLVNPCAKIAQPLQLRFAPATFDQWPFEISASFSKAPFFGALHPQQLQTMASEPEESDAVAVSVDVSNPPLLMDRGLTAWLQVLGSWTLFMDTW